MISIKAFIEELKKNKLNFFSGVPDSLFKDLCYAIENEFQSKHVVAANEGSAAALGIGYHLKTKKIPVIYMQNSGLGNAINPIISLADSKVYKIPLFLIVGWRGEPSNKFIDEPQHISQGKVTEKFLKNLGIKYKIINAKSNIVKIIKELKTYAQKKNLPVCMLIKKNSFYNNHYSEILKKKFLLREEFLKLIIDKLPSNSTIVSSTGILSRELDELLKKKKKKINNFMCVGGMGHAISVASGIAINTRKKVFCFDGDGAATMHLGSLTTSALQNNIVHIIFNNFSHESVGGHDTSSKHVKFYKLAKILGYKISKVCINKKTLINSIKKSILSKKSYFIEILCSKGHRDNISRPTEKMLTLKKKFIKNLSLINEK